MRLLSFALRGATKLHEARIPSGQAKHETPRRFGDELEAIFHRACAGNNLDEAADLMTVLEKWHGRGARKYWRDGRSSESSLSAMRAELERLTALRTS